MAGTDKWQRRLLPLMSGTLVIAGIFFAAISVYEFNALQMWLERVPVRISGVDWPSDASPGFDQRMQVAVNRGSFELEQQVVERRYGQATATMLARLWTRFMGFMTGMILAFVGAAFVLGKINEAPTTADLGGGGFKGAIATSSPGLVLAFLGAVLMTVSLSVTASTAGQDGAVYFRYAGAAPAAAAKPPALTPAQIVALARQPIR